MRRVERRPHRHRDEVGLPRYEGEAGRVYGNALANGVFSAELFCVEGRMQVHSQMDRKGIGTPPRAGCISRDENAPVAHSRTDGDAIAFVVAGAAEDRVAKFNEGGFLQAAFRGPQLDDEAVTGAGAE